MMINDLDNIPGWLQISLVLVVAMIFATALILGVVLMHICY